MTEKTSRGIVSIVNFLLYKRGIGYNVVEVDSWNYDAQTLEDLIRKELEIFKIMIHISATVDNCKAIVTMRDYTKIEMDGIKNEKREYRKRHYGEIGHKKIKAKKPKKMDDKKTDPVATPAVPDPVKQAVPAKKETKKKH